MRDPLGNSMLRPAFRGRARLPAQMLRKSSCIGMRGRLHPSNDAMHKEVLCALDIQKAPIEELAKGAEWTTAFMGLWEGISRPSLGSLDTGKCNPVVSQRGAPTQEHHLVAGEILDDRQSF